MAKVNWSPEAIQDFSRALDFIEREDVAIACGIEAEALQKADDRAVFPESGGIVPELGDRMSGKFSYVVHFGSSMNYEVRKFLSSHSCEPQGKLTKHF